MININDYISALCMKYGTYIYFILWRIKIMTDEEKKAIKDCDIIFINLEDMFSEESANDYRNSYKILKNLIDKQQKEIEEKNIVINKMSKDISRQLEEIERKNKLIEKNRIALEDCLKYRSEEELLDENDE